MIFPTKESIVDAERHIDYGGRRNIACEASSFCTPRMPHDALWKSICFSEVKTMWYFYLSPEKAAKAVALLAGGAREFRWQKGVLSVFPEKGEESAILRSLSAFGIFPSEKT